jgi:hypothetical protein
MIAEVQQERARLHKLKASPLEAIKELGWNTDDLVRNVINEGDPQWQQLTQQQKLIEAQKAELQEIRSYIDQYKTNYQQEQEQRRQLIDQTTKQAVYDKFLGNIATEEKCPALRSLYEPDEIVAKGDAIADSYRARTGKVASLEEIAEYLEHQASEKLASIRDKSRGQGNATKSKANGPRTLSAASASERRSSPRPVRDMDPTEEREALMAAAAEAMRSTA